MVPYANRLRRAAALLIVALFASLCPHLVGCASSQGGQQSTPGQINIAEAEQVIVEIERARIAEDWQEVNRHLSSVGYTPAQRAMSPSAPFGELAKAGRLVRFELLLSIGGAEYKDRATGAQYARVNVNVREAYTTPGLGEVHAEFSMLKEADGWKLAGVTASRAPSRR